LGHPIPSHTIPYQQSPGPSQGQAVSVCRLLGFTHIGVHWCCKLSCCVPGHLLTMKNLFERQIWIWHSSWLQCGRNLV
jgi:hypothetical protein